MIIVLNSLTSSVVSDLFLGERSHQFSSCLEDGKCPELEQESSSAPSAMVVMEDNGPRLETRSKIPEAGMGRVGGARGR